MHSFELRHAQKWHSQTTQCQVLNLAVAMMRQRTVDPKVKLCVRVTKKKPDKSVPWVRGEDLWVTAENLEHNEKHEKETKRRRSTEWRAGRENTSICTTEPDTEKSLCLAVLCFFCSPPLGLCLSFVTPPKESAAFHRAAVGGPTLGGECNYLITLLRRRRAHLGPWHLERPVTFTEVPACVWSRARLSLANSKVAAGEPERRAGLQFKPPQSSGLKWRQYRHLLHFFVVW